MAMQLLYQFDMSGDATTGELVEDFSDEPGCRESRALAEQAWASRESSDALAGRLAPQWPTHRQPPIDRAVMRLAHHEMATKRVPVNVAINEAVELAKEYGAENSPAFINGLLDKMAKEIANAECRSAAEPLSPSKGRMSQRSGGPEPVEGSESE